MTRLFAFCLLISLLVGCASTPPKEPDQTTQISMAEIAQRTGGQLTYDNEQGKGLVEAERAQLIAIVGMDRILFNGSEYLLGTPAESLDGDLYLPRRIWNLHLAQRFASAAARTAAEAELEQLPQRTAPMPMPAQPAQVSGGLSGLKVVIDAGHGGKDPGATYGGVTEGELNTAVAALVAEGLRARGAEVIETRPDANFVSLDQRVATGSNAGADLFVSIHANAFKDSSVNGVEVYHQADRPTTAAAKALAAQIQQQVVSFTGARDRGVREDSRGLRVLRKSPMPAVLVEVGYMTNPDELARMQDPRYQQAVAEGIVAGIEAHATGGRMAAE